MRSFGKKEGNREYKDRPGSYGILVNQDEQICIIRAFSGFTLPGGGAAPHEDPIDTLHREVIEETGFKIRILKEIGVAEQFLHAVEEGYFRKICHYFLCSHDGLISSESEVDHEVLWYSQSESLHKIEKESSHGWALRIGIDML